MPLYARRGDDSTIVIHSGVVVGPTKSMLFAAAAVERRHAPNEAPRNSRKHHEESEADKADADDGGRALNVDGVGDGDRDGADQHETNADRDGDKRTAV